MVFENKGLILIVYEMIFFFQTAAVILKPLQRATVTLSDASNPTSSITLPLKNVIEKTMEKNTSDNKIAADLRKGIKDKLETFYLDDEVAMTLKKTTACDPRYSSECFLNNSMVLLFRNTFTNFV